MHRIFSSQAMLPVGVLCCRTFTKTGGISGISERMHLLRCAKDALALAVAAERLGLAMGSSEWAWRETKWTFGRTRSSRIRDQTFKRCIWRTEPVTKSGELSVVWRRQGFQLLQTRKGTWESGLPGHVWNESNLDMASRPRHPLGCHRGILCDAKQCLGRQDSFPAQPPSESQPRKPCLHRERRAAYDQKLPPNSCQICHDRQRTMTKGFGRINWFLLVVCTLRTGADDAAKGMADKADDVEPLGLWNLEEKKTSADGSRKYQITSLILDVVMLGGSYLLTTPQFYYI